MSTLKIPNKISTKSIDILDTMTVDNIEVSSLTIKGNSPEIKYNVSNLSFPFTNLAPLFANFWSLTISDTTGFYTNQTVTLSGCSVPALNGDVTVGNVESPTVLWLVGISVIYGGTPVSGTISGVSSSTLIGGTSDTWSIANGTIKTAGGTMDFKPRDSVNAVSASLSQAGGLTLGDGVSTGGGSIRLFSTLGPLLTISEDTNYIGSGSMVMQTIQSGHDLTVRAQNSTGTGYAFMRLDGNNSSTNAILRANNGNPTEYASIGCDASTQTVTMNAGGSDVATFSPTAITFPSLASGITGYILYYDIATGKITYGAK